MAANMIVSVLLGGLVLLLLYLYESLVLKQKRLRSKLEKQGIRGPSPSSIFLGNIPEMKRMVKLEVMKSKDRHLSIAHEWPSKLFPYLLQWRNEYGTNFTYLSGSIQQLAVTDLEMVKEVSLCTSLNLGKPGYVSKDRKALFGQGIIAANGPIWYHQRKIIAPEFYFDRVKGMVELMVDCTTIMLRSWESKIEGEGGIAVFGVDEDLRSLSADIISRTSFGSNYSQGKEIFLKLRTLQKIMYQGHIGVPGARYLATKNNREIWRLEKEIHSMILRVPKQRSAEATYEKDLLQMIIEGAKNYGDTDNLFSGISQDNFIVDNCKSIYFAGHETTAITASWSLMLLAAYPEWQARARAELNMVIQETLRLYAPSMFVGREALDDIELNGILIPKGTNIQIPIPIMHRLPDIWGPDALDFNPKRFEHGILGACKFPQAYMPFGVGARICLGQHLAMTELKVILSLILSKFCFTLSPVYQHCPTASMVIEPEHGVSLQVRRV
ncbi:cytochrome P450 714C2 isoform X2 [Prunus persica]|uniref:cytochrome P450 714C2 isoform X2 n=1 Tax=Prunus persica TaxID=3760 RepID=UPI0009AB3CBD|nr:cytochrome P450 714C2 isoform X2 [Prunus persica]